MRCFRWNFDVSGLIVASKLCLYRRIFKPRNHDQQRKILLCILYWSSRYFVNFRRFRGRETISQSASRPRNREFHWALPTDCVKRKYWNMSRTNHNDTPRHTVMHSDVRMSTFLNGQHIENDWRRPYCLVTTDGNRRVLPNRQLHSFLWVGR
jgi:hypothetical protein